MSKDLGCNCKLNIRENEKVLKKHGKLKNIRFAGECLKEARWVDNTVFPSSRMRVLL